MSLAPTDFANPIRQPTPQNTADDKEEVHFSGNKGEMAANVEDSACKSKRKVTQLPRTTKKRGGGRKSRGAGGRSLDSRRFEAQRRADLEMPSKANATISLPKSK
jgi:hypothetical protein